MPISDRDLSHGARVTLACLAKARARNVRGQTVHYAGRPYLANRTRRTCRQVSRYTAELERGGRIVKVRPRRYLDPDRGWCTDGVQGYVIVRVRANVTPVSARLLRSLRARLSARRARPASDPQPPPVAEVLARMRGVGPVRAAPSPRRGLCCPACGGPHALAGCPRFQ